MKMQWVKILVVGLITIASVSSKADIRLNQKLEDELWGKIANVINLEYGELSHTKVEAIFEGKLDSINHKGNSYHYLGTLPSGDYFTILVKEKSDGNSSHFIFQWDNKIDIEHTYIDFTNTPTPKSLCIKPFDRKEDLKISDSIRRSTRYQSNQSVTYLTFNKKQNHEVLDTQIYLDEENDCLLRVEIDSSTWSLPTMPIRSNWDISGSSGF